MYAHAMHTYWEIISTDCMMGGMAECAGVVCLSNCQIVVAGGCLCYAYVHLHLVDAVIKH